MRKEADLLFLAGPNGVNDALDVIEELPERFRSRDRLQVRYIMDVCDDSTDRGFQRSNFHCDR